MLYKSPYLLSFPHIFHGFTLRASKDYSFAPKVPLEFWTDLSANVEADASFSLLSQVHGNSILYSQNGGLCGEADAFYTDKKGIALVIRTADCVPILVFSKDRVAAIHAGWRGLTTDIIEKTVSLIPNPIGAVIGPCIQQLNYEVGEEVVAQLSVQGIPESLFVDRTKAKPHVSLPHVAQWHLLRSGLPTVEIVDICTFSDQRFHSYRRDGSKAGRIASFIGLR